MRALEHRGSFWLLALLVVAASACSQSPSVLPVPPPAPQTPVVVKPQVPAERLLPAGNLMSDRIKYQLAIYYLPKPSKEPLAELDALVEAKFPQFRRVEKVSEEPQEPELAAQVEMNPRDAYPPPDVESLGRFGRGTTAEQNEALQATEAALVMDIAYPKQHVWTGYRATQELSLALAEATGGLIWDNATREVFSVPGWKERRLADPDSKDLDTTNHLVIHVFQNENDNYVRAITLGMEKFGLPDVVAANFVWSGSHGMVDLLNGVAQAIAEGAGPQADGALDVELRKLKNAAMRERLTAGMLKNATGVALVTLCKGTVEVGDPLNRLIEITFDRVEGPDVHAQQDEILSQAFGWEDTPVMVKYNDEIQAASRQARTKLPQLRADFNKGLKPGEYIQLKAPFAQPDEQGNENMWVEVTSWNDKKITGLLKNTPNNIPTLKAGQVVEILEDDVIDYIRLLPDGSADGNDTGKVIDKLRR